MARAAQNQAKQTYQSASDLTSQSGNNSTSLMNTLNPEYQAEINNPQGFGPTGEAAMTTAAREGAGGAGASAVGDLGLAAARNRNSGGFASAEDASVRKAAQSGADTAAGIEAKNEELKQKQIQEGLQGEQGLQSQQNADELAGLGLQNQSTNALSQAGQSGWLQNTLGVLGTLSGAGNAAANLGKAFCYIAAALYDGWDGPKTTSIRNYLQSINYGWRRVPLTFYGIFGESMAKNRLILWAVRPLFDWLAKKAEVE